jgi:hypothetical protein
VTPHGTVALMDRVRVVACSGDSSSPSASPSFAGFRFPPDVVLLAVRWYLRYGLSYRDVEELLAERGIDVDHVTIYRWVQRFTPLVIEAARPCRHSVGDRWFVDETYVRVAGVWRYVYRAVDQYGQVIDVYVSKRRNVAAATKFFETMLAGRDDPQRSSRIWPHSCCAWSTNFSTTRYTTRRSTRTTGSSVTTGDSRRGFTRCAVYGRTGQQRS